MMRWIVLLGGLAAVFGLVMVSAWLEHRQEREAERICVEVADRC